MIALFFVVCALAGAGLGLLLGRWLGARRAARREKIDLLLLLREPRILTKEHLQSAAERAFGKPVDRVAVKGPGGEVRIDGFTLVALPVGEPMVDDVEDAAEGITELRMRTTFKEHRAFVIVACIDRPKEASLEDAYRYVGCLAESLIDETTTLVYSPEAHRGSLITEEIREGLRSGDPVAAMQTVSFDAIGLVSSEDPRMAEAVAEAKARLPEFIEAVRSQNDLEMCLFKAPFSDGTHTEFMWVAPREIVGESIRGELSNEPFQVRGVKKGAIVDVEFADVSDWFCPSPSGMLGPFTEKIVREKI